MRQARQQSQDLNRTGDFIHALLHVEPGQSPPKAPTDLFYSSPIANGIMPHKEHISPFSQPPAPPPQLPLPEKPTMSPSDRHNLNALKRNDAERSSPINGKIDPSSSQILQLVDALSSAKREIDRQGSRVRELEDELKQERKARQHGEERMRAFLDNLHTSNKNSADIDEISSIHSEGTILLGNRELGTVESVSASTTRLQERLDLMLQEMRGLKDQIEVYKHRAETAEEEKSGLADMVDQIRSGVAKTSPISRSPQTSRSTANRTELEPSIAVNGTATNTKLRDDSGDTEMNGMTDKSILHPTELQNLVTAAMSLHRDDRFMQSAPYASMVGVVLIGVGIMAYLNGWQKLETS